MNPLERYSRQMRFYGIGETGQKKLLASRVALCGCGALGTVLANVLVRAGVGFVRVIDRDFVETSNLQRQVLFDENDVIESLPKSEAATKKLRAINSAVTIEPVVTDIDRTNIENLCRDVDLILDGTDNFEVRYLINDVSVKLGKPWVYGGCIGSHGQVLPIIPGKTPCLRCVFEAAPAPGETGTCETAGVLGPIVNIVASLQATEAMKILTGNLEQMNPELTYLDIWENVHKRIKVAPLLGKVDCPCCQRRRFEWLDGEHGSQTTSLCGRNAVQVSHRVPGKLNFEEMARHLSMMGKVTFNKFLLKFNVDDYEFTVFPDGRAIIKGTDDEDKARTLYAKYVGH
ncbi:MAG: thiazole biosynthesis adenylyltransferase ThiF [Planctomycetia bacterium]|nr:thiazole biosynthesis adenylyltransferase ThiF [Planctomycetia bacterium]